MHSYLHQLSTNIWKGALSLIIQAVVFIITCNYIVVMLKKWLVQWGIWLYGKQDPPECSSSVHQDCAHQLTCFHTFMTALKASAWVCTWPRTTPAPATLPVWPGRPVAVCTSTRSTRRSEAPTGPPFEVRVPTQKVRGSSQTQRWLPPCVNNVEAPKRACFGCTKSTRPFSSLDFGTRTLTTQ